MVGCAAAHSGASLRGHQLKAKQRKWCLQLGSLRPANIRLLQPRNIIRTSRFLGLTAFLMLLLSFVFSILLITLVFLHLQDAQYEVACETVS